MSFVAVSLKMYFGLQETLDWCGTVREVALADEGVCAGRTELVVFPSALAVIPAARCFASTPVQVGAQDVSEHDAGPYTGDVSAAMFAEAGARYAEVGHAERRRFHGETDRNIARKVAAVFRSGLVPLICIGEPIRQSSDEAARFCTRQLAAALETGAELCGLARRVVVAYEPVWAIGAEQPASREHVHVVCERLRAYLDKATGINSEIVYGGSAGPGLLDELADDIDGLFLGRYAHVAASLQAVLREACRAR